MGAPLVLAKRTLSRATSCQLVPTGDSKRCAKTLAVTCALRRFLVSTITVSGPSGPSHCVVALVPH